MSKTSSAAADLLHALDALALYEWNAARDLLEQIDDPLADRLLMLSNDLQKRERERERLLATTRHEIGNALSIALANIEGMIDGLLEPTPARRRGIREALLAAGQRLDGLKAEPIDAIPPSSPPVKIDLFAVSSDQIAFVSGLAKTKNVVIALAGGAAHSSGDPVRIGTVVRDALVTAVRRAPPGGSVVVSVARDAIEISAANSDGSQVMREIGLRFDA